jgi:hypothetical protein
MKKFLLCSIGAACLLSACVKQNVALISTPVTVVSQIVSLDIPNQYITSPDQNTTTNFTYQGKLLSHVTIAHVFHDFGTHYITTDFTYDANGLLKSSAISPSAIFTNCYDITSSTVTNSGGHISSISFYERDGTLAQTYTLTYENGLLKQIFGPNSAKISYSYDENGNNTSELDEDYKNGQPTGDQLQVTNSTFDDKVNFSSLVPLWVYFKCYTIANSEVTNDNSAELYTLSESMTYQPGKNNVLQSCMHGTFLPRTYYYEPNIPTQFTYNYVYNEQGYPTTINYPGLFKNTCTYTTVQ